MKYLLLTQTTAVKNSLFLLMNAFMMLVLASCSSYSNRPLYNEQRIEPIISTPELWREQATLYQYDRFEHTSIHLGDLFKQSASSDDVNALIQYLRAYSYYGPLKDISEAQVIAFDEMMTELTEHDSFEDSPVLQEAFSIFIYRYYFREPFRPYIEKHLETLIELLDNKFLTSIPPISSMEQDYAVWELMRAVGLLAHYANRDRDDLKGMLTKHQAALTMAMLNAMKRNEEKLASIWVLKNGYWALAKLNELSSNDERSNLDKKVFEALSNAVKLTSEQKKEVFSYGYWVNGFNEISDCEKSGFDALCIKPNLNDVLPIKHQCSERLFILTQELTNEQLSQSCVKLLSQENRFHELLDTQEKPVANDYNESLRVVIFDRWDQYHQYSPLMFDIDTNNGGMYIEGDPADPENQATFFSYRASWLAPEFKVWNLNHEYVHYLDGRFAKYGKFGHFPSHLVWWSEGIAEYISKGNANEKVEKILLTTDKKDYPTLKAIFATEYKDGTDRVYLWSYLAVRFLAENYPKKLQWMKKDLKGDFFTGYKNQLDKYSEEHQAEFEKWLTDYSIPKSAEEDSETESLPRKIGRYDYPSFLAPKHLKNEGNHRHLLNQ